MKINPYKLTISDLTGQFEDSVRGAWVILVCGIKLIIRPEFQREFVYSLADQVAVILTILEGAPLNCVYFSVNTDGTFEVIDGQQRILSILHFIAGDFSVEWNGETLYWHNLPADLKEKVLSYDLLTTYTCEGGESDKLNWFRRINTAGVELNNQELLNATYHGPFITSAREMFSKPNCRAVKVASMEGKPLMKGSPIRQDLLEQVLIWAADAET